MTPVFSTVLIIAVAISVSLTIIILYNLRRQKNIERLLSGFENASTEFNLSIAKRQVLGNSVIGYDDTNKKLLFLTLTGKKQDGYLIDLSEVRSLTTNRVYGLIENNKTKLSAYVEMISLQLNYKNGDKPLLLPFYDKSIDRVSELKERAKQAKDWQVMLSTGSNKNKYGTANRKKTTEYIHVSIGKETASLIIA